MAGEATAGGDNYPVQYQTYQFRLPLATFGSVASQILMLVDRDLVVDAASIRVETLANADITATLGRVATTASLGTETAITSALQVGTGSSPITAKVNASFTIDTTANRMVAGEMLEIKLSGTNATIANVLVSIRCRLPRS